MMHLRPAPVQWTVCRSRWLARVLTFLLLLAILSMWGYFLVQPLTLPIAMAWLTALVLLGVLARNTWMAMPTGPLRWDGEAWFWSHSDKDKDVPCTVVLHMDVQRLLIVTVHPLGKPPVWLWLETALDAVAWLALRRAVVASTEAQHRLAFNASARELTPK